MAIFPRTLSSPLVFTTLALSALIYANALQVPPRHANARNGIESRRGSHLMSTRADSATNATNTTKVQFGYFVNWYGVSNT